MAETRILGQDLEVSAVGLGCMGFTHAYGLPADKDELIKAIREAVEYGSIILMTGRRCLLSTEI